jgi:hypothetical protein
MNIDNPIEYVKQNFPGYRYVATAPVEPLQYFVRADGKRVEQALRTSPVIGKERLIVARDFPRPEPLSTEPVEVTELPQTEPVEPVEDLPEDTGLESPDALEEIEDREFFDGYAAEDDEDDDDSDDDDSDDDDSDDEPISQSNTPKPMNKSKLNRAVTTAFNTLLGALSKALKTTNVALNLALDNHNLSTVTADGKVAASFRIQRFPGSDPLLIVSKFSIEEGFRNSGLNRTLHQVLEAAAKNAGAAGILATVRQDNTIQNVVLEFTGWSPIQGFTNPATGAGVQIFYKEVGS